MLNKDGFPLRCKQGKVLLLPDLFHDPGLYFFYTLKVLDAIVGQFITFEFVDSIVEVLNLIFSFAFEMPILDVKDVLGHVRMQDPEVGEQVWVLGFVYL